MSQLASARLGEGPRALILLHGFLGAGRNLAVLARHLVRMDATLSAVTLDLTGHGASPPLAQGADLASLAADVLATAAELRITRPLALAGHSLGGRVGLRIALDNPDALGHLTLLDVSPSPIPPDTGDVRRVLDALLRAPPSAPGREPFRRALLQGGLATDAVEWLLLNLEPDRGELRWRIDRHALNELHGKMVAEDLWPAVEGRGGYRVHCIRAGRSSYVSDHDARRLEAAGHRVDAVPDTTHWLHVERPAEVARLVLEGLG
jgi:pimeloyl-ACP methyl ester carboxylesterase